MRCVHLGWLCTCRGTTQPETNYPKLISGWIHSPRETLRRDDHLEIVPCEAEAAYAGSLYVARWQTLQLVIRQFSRFVVGSFD